MDWLIAKGVPLEHMPNYTYSGMTRSWIHSPPQRDGSVITGMLLETAQQLGNINLYLDTRVTGLTSDRGSVTGLRAKLNTDEQLHVKAQSVILATSGFGNNKEMVRRFIPEFSEGLYFGAPYAKGDSIKWGQSLGAVLNHLGAYQSHSSISFPKMMLVTTYLINNGAIQVNQKGHRFGDETDSYSHHALSVQAQPDRVVFELFDEGILQQTLVNYPRFSECISAGIVKKGENLPQLAQEFDLDPDILTTTIKSYNSAAVKGFDEFGRNKFGKPLSPPYYGIKVTSALVQTLGGLRVDAHARVVREDGTAIKGLFAGGGAASGLAGGRPEGYLAGTGLLAAFGLGWIAGQHAAEVPSSTSV